MSKICFCEEGEVQEGVMNKIPYPQSDNGRVRVIAPVEVNQELIRQLGRSLAAYGNFMITEEIPHITVVSGVRKSFIEKLHFGEELRLKLKSSAGQVTKLADVKIPFVWLKQFQKERYSVIYLEPDECPELRVAQQVLYSFFQRHTVLKEDWKYNPKRWRPHLTVGRLEGGEVSDDVLEAISDGLPVAGVINSLLLLPGPNELQRIELRPM